MRCTQMQAEASARKLERELGRAREACSSVQTALTAARQQLAGQLEELDVSFLAACTHGAQYCNHTAAR